ncbi:MAG: cytochrome c [Deinococcus sp.]|nr:cytochrome c [Deinococcus sp.]
MRKWLVVLPAVLSLTLAAAQPGEAVFQQCAGCHQASGQGIPGVFPPLMGHLPEILSAKEGRSYLVQVLLYGLSGPISIKGQKYNGAMPAFGHLKDEQIAAVLNYVATSWGNDKSLAKDHKPFTAAEVAQLRQNKLTPAQLLELRAKLGLKP